MQSYWVCKNKVKVSVSGGGIFSKLMMALQNIEELDYRIGDCYLNVVDSRALPEDGTNPFDFVLDQIFTKEEDYLDATFNQHSSYSRYNKIYQSSEFDRLRAIAAGLKYKPELTALVDEYTNALGIDENTIGVHVRLCDMNIHHKQDYGEVFFDNYVEIIERLLKPESNIFVASDNNESIKKLQSLYGNRILYLEGFLRAETEVEDTMNLQLEHLKEKRFWQEAFIEMLLLSKCSELICRTSNLVNMAIISSNTFKTVTML
jgi:hypothetical protein